MKLNFKKMLSFFICMLALNSAHAYKFVLFTDDTKTQKADQIAELMKNTYPFTKFNIEVEIVRVQPHELTCESKNGIDRLVMCDNAKDIQKMAIKRGGDQAMILKDMPKHGGSSLVGGGVPVITTTARPRDMLHEYMHTLGLCDEYEYKVAEATLACTNTGENLAMIEPLDPYASDSMARVRHVSQIPWFSDISSTTPITNTGGTRLGTGDVDFKKLSPVNTTSMGMMLSEPTGLFKGKRCRNAFPPKTAWHPGGSATIMENANAGLGAPIEKIVERLMISKGAKKKLQYYEETDVVKPPKKEESAGSVVVSPRPMDKINDTARGFMKSFFSWTKELFENVKKVFTR